MSIFLVMLRKELLAQWRSYRLLVVVVVLLIFGLTSPLVARLTPELLKLLPEGETIAGLVPPPTTADAVAQYVKNVSQFGVILALLMTVGAVAQEKERGTAALTLVKPVPRLAFLGAKFAALGLTFAIGIAVAGLAAYYYTWILFDALDAWRWAALNGLMLLFVLVYVALTLFCSAASRSQVLAGGLAIGWAILLSALGAIPALREHLPGQLLGWAAELAVGGSEAAWSALAVSCGLVVAAFVGAWGIFARQELW